MYYIDFIIMILVLHSDVWFRVMLITVEIQIPVFVDSRPATFSE